MTYYYVITAVNVIGEGPRSGGASVGVPLPSLPTVPLDLVAKAESGRVVLTWSTPAFNGGSPIIGYKIFRGTSPGVMDYIASTEGTTYEDTGLQDGMVYYYAVTAVNEVGDSERTNAVTATLPTNPLVASPIWFLAAVGVATAIGSAAYLVVHRLRSATR
jgi:hypothetical protein